MPTSAPSQSCLGGVMGQILRKSGSRRKTASKKRKRGAPNTAAKKSTLEKQGVSGKKRNGGTGGTQNNKKKRSPSPNKKQRDKAGQDDAASPNLKKTKMTRFTGPESQRKRANNAVESAPKPAANKNSKKKLSSLAQPSVKPATYATPIPPQSSVAKSTRNVTPKPEGNAKQRPTRAKVVVIDGTSAAAAYGGDMSEAVARAVAYYEERYVQALAVVPYGVEAAGAVAAPPGAPTRHVALREAARRGGDLLCNGDLEADLAQQQGRARRRRMRRFLQRHWIPFTFIRGELLPNPHPRRLLESVHAPRQVAKRGGALRFVGRLRRGRAAYI